MYFQFYGCGISSNCERVTKNRSNLITPQNICYGTPPPTNFGINLVFKVDKIRVSTKTDFKG